VPINIKGGFPYSHSDAQALLAAADSTFAQELDRRSPGAVAIIRKHQVPVRGVFMDVDIEEMGRTLLEHLPHLLSKQFVPSASSIVIEAQLEDFVQAMEQAKDAHATEAMRAELQELKLSALEKRAREAGACVALVEEAKDSEDPKSHMIELILSMAQV